jgi:hypothetical protein
MTDEVDVTDTSDPAVPDRRLLVAGALVAAVVGAVGWFVVWRDDQDSDPPPVPPAAVVAEFFQARRDGDCEGLMEVVAESSWSDGGDRSRSEFVAQCEEALDGFRPRVEDVTMVVPSGTLGHAVYDEGEPPPDEEEDPGWEVVLSASPGDGTCCDLGHVVAENGRWRVALDDYVFSVGPRPDEAVEAEVSTYNRSGEGLRPQLGTELSRVEVRGRDAEVTVDPVIAGITDEIYEGEHPIADPDWSEVVTLVRDGLAWRVDGEVLPRAKAYLELRALVLTHIEVDGRRCYRHADFRPQDGPAAPVRVEAQPGYEQAITREFPDCGTTVTLARFAEREAAEAAAAALARAADPPGELHVVRAWGEDVVQVTNWSGREPEAGLPGGGWRAPLVILLGDQLERL